MTPQTNKPYGATALDYWAAGWRGVLPLPPGAKTPPPKGSTGAGGYWPSFPDVMAWTEGHEAGGNIAIRLPPTVIGIDVDTYEGKQGASTMLKAFEAWGNLPGTYCSTSRPAGSGSGIFLYRVPDHALGLAWPGQVGPDVEIIQTRHRYMVAPPSVHPSGREYQWLVSLSADVPLESIPIPESLPFLPDTWVSGLTGGRLATDTLKADVTDSEISAWITGYGYGTPCRIMHARLERVLRDLVNGGSRHDIATRATMAFAHLSVEGHRGASRALVEFKRVWLAAVMSGGSGQRTTGAAEAEWHRLLAGAVGVLTANGELGGGQPPDPCADPFWGILAPEGRLSDDEPTLPNGRHPRPSGGPGVSGAALDTGMPPPRPPETGDATGGLSGGRTVPGPMESPTRPGTAPPEVGIMGTDQATITAGQGAHKIEAQHHIDDADPAEPWDMHAVAVQLEVGRLRVRQAARRALEVEEHARTWRAPESLSLKELLALPDEPLSYRVADVMPSASNVTLTAQYKTGKTTLVNALVKAVADGGKFLDSFEVKESATIAVWNYEVGQAQYTRWLRDIGVENTDRVHVLNLRGYRLPLSIDLVRDWSVEWLAERDIAVWVLDPFARAFTGGNENDNAEVGPFLEVLDDIKAAAGVSELIVPTHTGRAVADQGAERARGATRLDDWADVRWLLTKDDEGARYFRATGRDVETDEGRLDFDPLTRALSLTGGARPPRAAHRGGRGAPGAQNGSGDVLDVVLEVLADEPGVSGRQLRQGVRDRGVAVRSVMVDEAVRRLTQQGRIRIESDGRATRHFLGGTHSE